MATERAARAVLDDECLIAEELQGLGLLRAYALACLREGHCGVEHQEEAQPARERTQTLSPAQFIRVWTDTAARVVQLLRVRRQPAGHGGLSEVLDQATDYVQARLPFPWPDDTQA